MESKRTLRKPIRRQSALIVALSLLLTPMVVSAGTTPCLTGSSAAQDLTQIASLRRRIDGACVCSSFDGSAGKAHRDYVACATDIVRAEATSAAPNLRAACVASVRQMYKESTCGTARALNAVPCIKTSTRSGKVTCSIKATTKKDGDTASGKCSDTGSATQVACANYTSCIDAADTNADFIIGAPGDSGACVALPTATPTSSPTASPTPTLGAVDCVVSAWSEWSKCTKPCGGGTQSRSRTVITEAANGGAACPALTDTQPCNPQPCPIDCAVSAWSDWSMCSASCGGGTQSRSRTVVTTPAFGGTACPALSETQNCNKQPCPVDCVVSDWSAWSACSASCGGGTQSRSRTVLTSPSGGGAACPNLQDTRSCNEQPCPVDCVVSAWSDWSTCSASCGGGTQSRSRTVLTSPAFGGAACPMLQDSNSCNQQPCPVDCVVSAWSDWSACSVSCGGGTQSRSRTVLTSPAFGGAACPMLQDSDACNTQPCA